MLCLLSATLLNNILQGFGLCVCLNLRLTAATKLEEGVRFTVLFTLVISRGLRPQRGILLWTPNSIASPWVGLGMKWVRK